MISISNFYENLVIDQIGRTCEARQLNLDYDATQDIACLALNQLPPRYIRHTIDTIFYIPDEERASIDNAVADAVSNAIDKVTDNPR
ncbi:MAG: late competence development ComFB family protein [Thiotrichaceae bacterium]|nr:late competence development ComFB family protein [Thiotrichaceae bacterium]PCI15072.1 MAG: competence protein ComFB [Thiotrichales bacterium]